MPAGLAVEFSPRGPRIDDTAEGERRWANPAAGPENTPARMNPTPRGEFCSPVAAPAIAALRPGVQSDDTLSHSGRRPIIGRAGNRDLSTSSIRLKLTPYSRRILPPIETI